MSNYPPGTTTQDLKRAGIIDDRPECYQCGRLIGDGDAHEEDCINYGIDGRELDREYEQDAKAEPYEDQR